MPGFGVGWCVVVWRERGITARLVVMMLGRLLVRQVQGKQSLAGRGLRQQGKLPCRVSHCQVKAGRGLLQSCRCYNQLTPALIVPQGRMTG